jgi:hypothetical protein
MTCKTRWWAKTVTGVVDKVGDTAGALTGDGKQEGDALSLKLDLNSDVYVKLKEKVHSLL